MKCDTCKHRKLHRDGEMMCHHPEAFHAFMTLVREEECFGDWWESRFEGEQVEAHLWRDNPLEQA